MAGRQECAAHHNAEHDGLRSGLLRRFGQSFETILNIFRDSLQSLASGLRSGGDFLDVGEGVGIAGFFAKFFKKWIDLRKNKEHFAATAGLQKKFFVERPMQHEGRGHVPIAAYLAQPRVLLAGKRIHNFDELVCVLWPEFHRKPVSCFAHLRFAA